MTAGMKFRASIIRNTQLADDAAGGAQWTGTVVYQDVMCQFQRREPNRLLVEQGIEFRITATALLRPVAPTGGGGMVIYEEDEFALTWPVDHPDAQERWRVVGVQNGASLSPYDKRRLIRLALTRIERQRVEQR